MQFWDDIYVYVTVDIATCRKFNTTTNLGISSETILITITLHVFHRELRFPFEMKEYGVQIGKHNPKSSNLVKN